MSSTRQQKKNPHNSEANRALVEEILFSKRNFNLPKPTLTLEEQNKLAQEGTEEALTALVMENINAGFGYGRIYCGSRFSDAELLSIVYKAMMAAAKRFRPGDQKLISYCKPFIRGELHRAWKQKAPIGLQLPEFPPPPSGVWSPDDEQDPGVVELAYVNFDYESLDKDVAATRLSPFLKRLTTHERLVVDLIYFGGYNQVDAAELMGVARSAVQQVLKRVWRKFKRWLS